MNKFSQSDYTKDAIAQLVKKLHVADDYPYEILAEYANLSASMMRQIADGNREMKAHNFECLKFNLADREGNTRAYKIGTPPGYSVVKIGEALSDGCPKDEYIDGGEALHLFLNGHKSTNIDVIDESIQKATDVVERMKAERARIAGKK